MRLLLALTLALCACSSNAQTTSPDDVLKGLSCFQSVIALIASVRPGDADAICVKIERGDVLSDLERQLLLEGVQRLRAAGKCLKG